MKIKLLMLVSASLLFMAAPSFASKQSNCRVYYDKFYMNCYKYGKQKQSAKACEKATTAMEEALTEEAENVKEEGIASFLATVCDGACQSAVEGEAAPNFKDFQEMHCK